ncbi:MAG: hypothetical protein DRQ14_01630 [Candidatus Latescibacterota bacterium]|nr:MAG: hypothetical protein DRQ14_01630 [Candidatus Latescibacterota bacterium]
MEWKAQWIWAQEGIGSKNLYLCFRKSFNIPGQVAQASACCTADSMYKLYINGKFVGRGPARGDRFHRSYDRYNLTPLLVKGKNEVLAVVHYRGEDTYDGVSVRGGFLFQLEGRTMTGRTFSVRSDRSWEVGRTMAWDRRSFRIGPGLGFCEEYDARREEVDWRRAAVLAPADAGPWGSLEPRGMPLPMEEFLPAGRVVVVGRCKPPEGRSFSFDLGERFGERDAVAYLSTYLWSGGSQEVELSLGSSGGVKLWVDGEEVLSYHVHGRAEPGQHRMRLKLDRGWHQLLLKADHSAGEWKVYLDLEGDLGVSAVRDLGCGPCWMAIGPFENEMVGDECVGFSTRYPPEEGLDFGSVCPGKGGEVEWVPWDSVAERMSEEEIEPSEFHEGEMVIPAGEPTAVVLDFGREVVGFPRISLEAPEGTVVDLGYGDELEGGRLVPPEGKHYADRYVCREGVQEWETFGRRAFRYVQLTFRRATGPVRLGEVGVNLTGYPVRELGSFVCSDELLNRIWEVGRYTVKLCMYDAYESDPLTHIQRPEDTRTEALVNYYAFGDYKLISRTLRQFARSQGEDGMLREAYPSAVPFPSSPRASALWTISLWEYVLYSGDSELARELLPCLERALEGMERYEGDDAETKVFYAGALGAASRMALLLGDEAGYAKYLGRFNALATSTDIHPRKECGLADFLAVCFGVGEDAKVPPEGLSFPPYQLSYVAEALLKMGRKEALEVLRGWGRMLEEGATTWWEDWEGGARCYGASSGPTYLLSAYILGIVPIKPGWRRFRVMPRPCGLEWAEGDVPTPFGKVSASWRWEGGKFRLSLEAPPECVAEVGLPGRGELLRNGRKVQAKEEGGYLWCELRPEGREELEVSPVGRHPPPRT